MRFIKRQGISFQWEKVTRSLQVEISQQWALGGDKNHREVYAVLPEQNEQSRYWHVRKSLICH